MTDRPGHDRRYSLSSQKLRDELAETVRRRFAETFAAVAANFEEVAATLFPGGDGRLRLVDDRPALIELDQLVAQDPLVVGPVSVGYQLTERAMVFEVALER